MKLKKFIKKLEKELNFLKTAFTLDLDDVPLTKSDRANALAEYDTQFECIIKLIDKFKKEHNM